MKKLIILYMMLAVGMSLHAQQVAVSYEIETLNDQQARMEIYLQSLTEKEQQIKAINFSLAMTEACVSVESQQNIFVEAWTNYLQEEQLSQDLELSYQNQSFSHRWQYGCADPGLPGTSAIVIPAKGETPLLAMTITLKGSCLEQIYLEQQHENPVNQMGDTEVKPVAWTIFHPETEVELSTEQSIQLYPNPVKDWLYVNFEGEFVEHMQLKLSNQEGKIIWEKEVNPFENPFHKFNLTHLPSAVYILSISSQHKGGQMQQVKVLKQ